jgi:PhzF family phenazine biosynthesis protein
MLLSFRTVTAQDVPRCYELEMSSYPEDEAASLQSLLFRQQKATEYFLCAEQDDEGKVLVGFICATRCSKEFTKDSLYNHIPNGNILVIHSVVIDPKYRRLGFGTTLLKEYLKHVVTINKTSSPIEKVMLMAKSNLLTFYIAAGFQVNGISPIQHGKDTWYELEFALPGISTVAKPIVVGTPYWVVDSFTDTFGCGNPAAVVLMSDTLNDTTLLWRKTVAKEFNLSETAFLWKRNMTTTSTTQGTSQNYDIRFYTCSGIEVDLCGHATLASAAALFRWFQEQDKEGSTNNDGCSSLTFHTNNPDVSLTVWKENEEQTSSVVMEFPWKTMCNLSSSSNTSNTEGNVLLSIKDMLQDSLGITTNDILFVGSDGEDLFIEITTSSFYALPSVQDINFSPMTIISSSLSRYYSRGIIVCSESDEPGIDFMSRFWGPKVGIMEDPVTGSAHCLLGPYFYSRYKRKRLIGKQMSSRGGVIECEMIYNDVASTRKVRIIGSAILTMKGFLQVSPTK